MKQSEWIQGNPGNYGWPVLFELYDGYLRIEQNHPEPKIAFEPDAEIVLLSRKQVKELLKFLGARTGGVSPQGIKPKAPQPPLAGCKK
jgi:hypothetical protein